MIRVTLLVLFIATPALAQQWEPSGDDIAGQAGQLVTWLLGVSGAAAWIAAMAKDSGVLRVLMPIINLIGGNVGAAKNDPAAN
jgi:hypothetical protein